MSEFLYRMDRIFAGLPATLRRHRWVSWGLLLFVLVVSGAGAGRIRVDMTMESFFEQDDPVLLLHDRFKDVFGSDELVYVVYEALDGDIFSAQSLQAVRDVQDALFASADSEGSPLTHVLDVQTIVNVRHLDVQGDMLRSRPFVGNDLPATDAEREALRREALSDPDYPQLYLSRDSRYGGIVIRTDFGVEPEAGAAAEPIEAFLHEEEKTWPEAQPVPLRYRKPTMPEYADFTRALEKVLEQSGDPSAREFYPVGNPVLMGFFNDVLSADVARLLVGALAIMLLVLGTLFRSVSAVLWPILVVVTAATIMLGLMGWAGVTLSLTVSVLLLLVLVVGIADSMHILSGYAYFRHQGQAHEAALSETMGRSGLACLLTSLTTAIGLTSLLVVPIPPIRAFGLSAAVGVMLAFVLTMTLLPLLLDLWHPARKAHAGEVGRSLVQSFLARIEPVSEHRPVAVTSVFLLVSAVALFGLLRLQIDSNLVQIIREGLPIRNAYRLVDREMGGAQNLEILLQMGEADALKDPEVLQAMERAQQQLEEAHGDFVVRTQSLADITKKSFQALNDDRPEMYRIPEGRKLLAQTLLLFELADPEDRELLVSESYDQARISVRLLNFGSMAYLDFFDEVQRELTRVFEPLRARYPDMDVGITGSLPLLMRMADDISRAQIQSFGLVVIVVTVLLLIVFASAKAGLLATLPNVFPVLVTFGAMGLFGIPLDADTLIIAPVVIGIAVDDTIHIMTHYRANMTKGADIEQALYTSLSEVGQAITYTTVTLVAGFLILVTSMHQGIAHFGVLTAVAFSSALLADLILLPALVRLTDLRFGR